MKLLISLLICCFLVISCVTGFSQSSNSSRETKTFINECVIDPVEVFDKWELVGYSIFDGILGLGFDVYFKNPKDSDVKYVNLMIFPLFLFKAPHGICSLAYLYNGSLFFFNYNEQLKKFESFEPQEETKEITWKDFEKWFDIKRGKKA